MEREKQKQIVFEIVKELFPIRTEQVKIIALRRGISCADRYLRWLAQENKIFGMRLEGDRTKTWYIAVKAMA